MQFGAVKERMQVLRTAGVTILNDTYNANPDSVLAALQTLASIEGKGKKIVVLGDMKELGNASEQEHRNIGRALGRFGFGFLLTHGNQAKLIYENADIRSRYHYDQKNMMSEYLYELLSPGDVVLVKGSRGMRMEDVVTFLQDRLSARERARRDSDQKRM
jgi:UDP-N-acetylmuramyl pentapeptide synthase